MNTFKAFLVFFSLLPLSARAEDGIIVIVNANAALKSITTEEFSDFYFKKKKQWPDGESVRFVDHATGSPERKNFLGILKKSASEVDLFWIGQKLYTGDSAPLQVRSDAMTIQFVTSFKGAIGYVSASTSLKNEKVKSLQLVPSEKN